VKFVDEYRDPAHIRRLLDRVAACMTRDWTVMEVCGGQTHAFLRFGLEQLLPDGLTLIHGPGCPVCVTSELLIDAAIELVEDPAVMLCTYGDMLRVPGSHGDLLSARADGGDVRVVYSAVDAVELAQRHPHRRIILFAVGFETTTPGTALAVLQAAQLDLHNFFVIPAHVRVPPALRAIMRTPEVQVQGFLAAGHVCAVMGTQEYVPIAEEFAVPIVVTGFEPVDLLQGLLSCVQQLEQGCAQVDNQYQRVVRDRGNATASQLIAQVFEPVDRAWRGMGVIEGGGLGLRPAYARFDALHYGMRSQVAQERAGGDGACCAGQVLIGAMRPQACPQFGINCTPEHPLGAPMVSSEGACAAYYHYRQQA
jgi:hydrogenase expression/formation protein HypD